MDRHSESLTQKAMLANATDASYTGTRKGTASASPVASSKSSAPKLAKRDSDRQIRERPTLSAELPQTLRPQRPKPWTAQNHIKNFPKLTPVQQSAIPELMAKSSCWQSRRIHLFTERIHKSDYTLCVIYYRFFIFFIFFYLWLLSSVFWLLFPLFNFITYYIHF